MKKLHIQQNFIQLLNIKTVIVILLISSYTACFNQDYSTLSDAQLSDIMYNNYFNQKLMPEDFEYLHKTPAQIEQHNANVRKLYTLVKDKLPEEFDKLTNNVLSKETINFIKNITPEQATREVANLSSEEKQAVLASIQTDIKTMNPTFMGTISTTTSNRSAAMSFFYNNPSLESAYAAVTDPVIGITALTGVAAVALYYKYQQYVKEQEKIKKEKEVSTNSEQQSLIN